MNFRLKFHKTKFIKPYKCWYLETTVVQPVPCPCHRENCIRTTHTISLPQKQLWSYNPYPVPTTEETAVVKSTPCHYRGRNCSRTSHTLSLPGKKLQSYKQHPVTTGEETAVVQATSCHYRGRNCSRTSRSQALLAKLFRHTLTKHVSSSMHSSGACTISTCSTCTSLPMKYSYIKSCLRYTPNWRTPVSC